MKNLILFALLLVSLAVAPASATLVASNPLTGNTLTKETPLLTEQLDSSYSQNTILTKDVPSKEGDNLGLINPFKSKSNRNIAAVTELKIDLDNFEMEYVLRIH